MLIEQCECVPQPAVGPLLESKNKDAGKIWIAANERGQIGDPFGLSVIAQGIAFGRQIDPPNRPPKLAVAG